MAWKPIPADEWQKRAEADFWDPYGRKRADRPKSQMVKKQLKLLKSADLESALTLAKKLGLDEQEGYLVRMTCLEMLTEVAKKAGEIDLTIDYMLEQAKLNESNGLPMLTGYLCAHQRADRAAEAIAVTETYPPANAYGARELNLAVLFDLTGDRDKAIEWATIGFDKWQTVHHRSRFGGIARSTAYRATDRKLFELVQRGGAVRFTGLLGSESACTPQSLTAVLKNNIYFKNQILEPTDDRLIVDLEEFSLDFRWVTDGQIIENVQRRYNRFEFKDRRHIPPPPAEPTQALLVLAIGDDTSLAEVVNPLIELVGDLDQFGECIFYDRVGPLSRRDDLEAFEPITTSQFDKLMRGKVKSVLTEAGFDRSTTRRFICLEGPLGYAAGLFFKIEKPKMRIMSSLQVYYRDILEEGALDQTIDKNGEFNPRALHHDNTRCYLSQYKEWTPNDPSLETVSGLLDTIVDFLKNEWLPLVERTRDLDAELKWIEENLAEIGDQRVWPTKNRFGAKTKAELAAEITELLNAEGES